MNTSRKDIFDLVARKQISMEEARRRLGELAAEPTPARKGPTSETATRRQDADVAGPHGRQSAEDIGSAAHRDDAGPRSASPIAVIGMSARFPGAPDLDRFWRNLLNGVDAVSEIPEHRWRAEDWYHPDPDHPNTTISRWGSFLEDIDRFDPGFFNISATEAEIMDPQQRLFLEGAWHALEDAGYDPHALTGSALGLFVGAKSTRYLDFYQPARQGTQPLASRMLSVIPARLSYLLNLKGPSMMVDTECSSSLVAVHQACQAIRNGECDMALAGGITLLIEPELFITLSKAQMLSPRGRCATFDAEADGIVMGEGLGLVLLKPLDQALADHDAIYAVIEGSAVNQDGKTNGITAPNTLSQIRLGHDTYDRAGIEPSQLGLMECHGTGTSLGDPIEIEALTRVFRERGAADARVPIGSIKTNLGHTLLAAGAAGLLKAALAVARDQIPPSLHFRHENPQLRLAQSPFFVAERVMPFKPGRRFAAVSAFGASGTNCQVIVGQAPPLTTESREDGPLLWLFSGRNEKALEDNVAAFRTWLARDGQTACLADAAFTLACGRTHFRTRLAFVAQGRDRLAEILDDFGRAGAVPGETFAGRARANAKGSTSISALLDQAETARRVPRAWHALLTRLAQAHIEGEALDFSALYPLARHRRIHLPGYAFQRERHWLFPYPAPERTEALTGTAQPTARRLESDAWYLADHVIDGRPLLPGVFQIHLILEAARRRFEAADNRSITLANLAFTMPVAVDGSTLDIDCRLAEVEGQSDRLAAEIVTDDGVHTQAQCRLERSTPPEPIDLHALKNELRETWDRDTVYRRFAATGIDYGSSFRVVERLAWDDRRALANLALPESRRDDHQYAAHPALLDGAFQTVLPLMGASMAAEPDAVWIPFAIGAFRQWGPLPDRAVALAVAHPSRDGAASKRFELFLADEQGEVRAHFQAFAVRRLRQETQPISTTPAVANLLLGSRFQAIDLPGTDGHRAGPIIVFQDGDGTFADHLRAARSEPVLCLTPGSAFRAGRDAITFDPSDAEHRRRLAEHLANHVDRPRALIDANLPVGHGKTATDAAERLRLALDHRVHLYKLLWRVPHMRRTRVLYLHAEDRTSTEPPIAESLAGFYRTLFREKPEWEARVVGLDSATESDLQRVCADMEALLALPADAERELRLGTDHRWSGRRLVPVEADTDSFAWSAQEHYLVTGGGGGIGRILGRHLALEWGAAVTLLGRSAPRPEHRDELADIQARDGRIQYLQADLRDTFATRDALDQARTAFGPIHAIHHTAGVIRDALILRKSSEEMAEVLDPKVTGTLVLDAATREDPLRAFVLYSAATSVLGNLGQADYATANRFLDSFATWRNGSGAPGRCVSIAWPLWRHGGMQVPEEAWTAMSANAGLAPLDDAAGMAQVRQALSQPADTVVSLCSRDRERLRDYLGRQGLPLDGVTSAKRPVSNDRGTAPAAPGPESDALADFPSRVTRLLVALVAAQVGLNPDQVDPQEDMDSFGLDSINAMQITERLEEIAGPLPKTLFFEYGCLEEIGAALAEHHRDAFRDHFGDTRPAAMSTSPRALQGRVWDWMRGLLARETKLDPASIDPHAPLDELGMDSIMAMNITATMEDVLGSVSKTLFFEHGDAISMIESLCAEFPTELATHFGGGNDGEEAALGASRPARSQDDPNLDSEPEAGSGELTDTTWYPVRCRDANRPVEIPSAHHGTSRTAEDRLDRDIAIIAVDGRYPQADSLDSFWDNLRAGKDCIREIPADRWPSAEFDGILANRRSCKWGGFMDDITQFDPLFFNIAPREATLMDPQERMALETSWRVFENAGYTRARLQEAPVRGKVGVYMATMYPEYMLLGLESALRGQTSFANSMFASFANRTSYFFNLNGPSICLDTMCSGSITAIGLAISALRAGQVYMALAGGVSLISHPYRYVLLAKGGFFSSDGRCRGFGEGGDGYVPGEGFGSVLLKRMSDALADGDPILGVIRGVSLNHGGRATGYTVPNPKAQADLIRAAIEDAGIEPREVSYVEAHGTGTALGDPIEIAGLTRAFGPLEKPPAMGSVKSNIGHLEPAAGIASLTKVLLQMRHRQLVPTLHVDRPNPHIDWDAIPFRLQRETAPWQSDGRPRIAALSSFGAGGANAHIIIQEPPSREPMRQRPRDGRHLVALSARTPTALTAMARALRTRLDRDDCDLADLSWTLRHREPMAERAAAVISDRHQLHDFLDRMSTGETAANHWRGNVEQARTDARDACTTPEQAAKAFCQGAAIDWDRFGCRGEWIDLPNYTFDRRRCWLDITPSGWSKPVEPRRHPLVGPPLATLEAGQTFPITAKATHPLLAEHRIRDAAILPGVATFEILRQALSNLSPARRLGTLRNLVWLHPLTAEALDPQSVDRAQLHLSAAGSQVLDWQLVLGDHRTAARGEVTGEPAPAEPPLDLKALTARCPNAASPDELYATFDRLGLDYGRHFRTIERLHVGDGQAVAQLTTRGRADLPEEALLPGMLDGALQTALGLCWDSGRQPPLMVPFSVGEVRFHAPIPDRAWAVVEKIAQDEERGLLRYDVRLTDDRGQVCLTLREVAARAWGRETTPIAFDVVARRLRGWQEVQPRLSTAGTDRLERAVAPAIQAHLAPLGLPAAGEPFARHQLADRLGILPKYGRWLQAWLADMARFGWVTWRDDRGTFTENPGAGTSDTLRRIAAEHPEVAAHVGLLEACLRSLTDVLTGRIVATDVVFPGASMELVEGIYKGNAIADFHNRAVCEAVTAAVEAAEGRPLAILEVGSGTGGTSASVLEALARLNQPITYLYTDVSPGFVQYGKRRFGNYPFVQFRTYDLEREPESQGLTRGGFDLVLAANVVHATPDIRASLDAVKSLLKRDGLLVLNEISSRRAFSNATFGLLDGWWKFTDPERRVPLSPALSPDHWRQCLGQSGFTGFSVTGLPGLAPDRLEQAILISRSDGVVANPVTPPQGAESQENAPETQPTKVEPAQALAQALLSRQAKSESIAETLIPLLCDVLGCGREELQRARPFSEYGVDSIVAVDLITRINQHWQLNLRPTLLFDYNHVNSLAAYLAELPQVNRASVPTQPVRLGADTPPPIAAAQAPVHAATAFGDHEAPGGSRRHDIADQLCAIAAEVLGCTPAEIRHDRPFSEYGVDSIVAVDLITRINRYWQLNLRPTLLFDYNDVSRLAEHLADQPALRAATPTAPTSGNGPVVPRSPAPALNDEHAVLSALAAGDIDLHQADTLLAELTAP
ncbi:SDR family NAD(P)-dependent oxidoreductase [Sulfidibacter corallicola]|uniref:SDR family NAD(P)-dependent oxidoreductase n=1 Tax=Sulfidibacter corallicola TaxID=2818388 RepID=A0A8A4TKI2_SULCO|nr:SDR family NAD(P)-dependent oxidoreductase [Sulfidibacter corallicola]QTD50519.1 SDR family NAD(P)-dependent oxidoreductase [Sulfidibacter corallicola]